MLSLSRSARLQGAAAAPTGRAHVLFWEWEVSEARWRAARDGQHTYCNGGQLKYRFVNQTGSLPKEC